MYTNDDVQGFHQNHDATTRRDWLCKTADDLSVANGRDANVTKIKVWSGYRATSQHRAGTTA